MDSLVCFTFTAAQCLNHVMIPAVSNIVIPPYRLSHGETVWLLPSGIQLKNVIEKKV